MTRPSTRNPGMLVHRLQWSQSHGRPVKITLKAGVGTKLARIVRTTVDEGRREATRKARSASCVVVECDDGTVLAVDSIAGVQLPLGDSGAAFGEG